MPRINLWFRAEGCQPELIDSAAGPDEAAYLFKEYTMAYALLPGQHRHGKDKLWTGRCCDEPGKEIPDAV